MKKYVEKLPHSCGTTKGLQVFEQEDGTYDGFCFACDTVVNDPYSNKPEGYKPIAKKRSQRDIEGEIKEIRKYKCCDLDDRKLKKESLEYFGIKIGVSESDGTTPKLHYYPYVKGHTLLGYKVRLIENKKMWSLGDIKDADLFGWFKAYRSGAKKLFICEGELDAVALYQVLKEKQKGTAYEDNPIAVVSLPFGSSSAEKSISKLLPQIRNKFKEVILVFDMDDSGQEAAKKVAKIFPEVLLAHLPEKDANDCLIKGRSKALFNSVMFQATKPKNSRVVWGRDLHEKSKVKAEWGLSYPWKGLTDATRGMRFGETIYIAAGEKMGKSEIVNALAAHCIKEHNLKVLLAKPEESNIKTYKMINSKICGKIFHDPKIEFDNEAFEEGGKILKDKLCMLNLYQHIDWETLKGDITYAVSEGVKAVFIDPITNLVNGLSISEANTKLQTIAQELAEIAMDLDIVIFIFCHLNKPPKGATPWDRGGKITTDYFAGSSAMARSCNYAWGLEGNKDPDLDEEIRNTRTLEGLADREFGESFSIPLYWDRSTGLFNEMIN